MCLLRWFEGPKERWRLTKRAALLGDVHVEGKAAMERRHFGALEEARKGAAEEARLAGCGKSLVLRCPKGRRMATQGCRLHDRYRFVTGKETTA
jgi:hypothetical protein